MAFISKFRNYSDFAIPTIQTSITFANIDYTASLTYANGGTLKYKQAIWTRQNKDTFDFIGLPISNVNVGSLIYATKTNNNYYIMFVVASVEHKDRFNVLMYLNNKLSLDRAFNTKLQTIVGIAEGYTPQIACYLQNGYFFLISKNPESKNKSFSILAFNISDMEKILGGKIPIKKESPDYGPVSEPDGYNPDMDDTSDIIPLPPKPQIGVTNVGFVNVYNPSLNALQNFGSELFPDSIFPELEPPTGEEGVADSLVKGFNNVVVTLENLVNTYINSNLIGYVIDCHCIPIKPSTSDSESIKIGFKTFSQSAPRVNNDYIDFDCGILNIKEYYSNFIDYVGTRAKLFLPFVGYVPIQPEYFQNGLLQVIYRFNIIDGSFMCYVLSSSSKSELVNSVIASYGGNACVHIPITGSNYASMISSILNGTVATASSITRGNLVDGANNALNTFASKPEVMNSNGYNSTSSYLTIRYPYLIIEREVSNFSESYTNEYGLPSNITKVINELSGFFQMDNIHIDNVTATNEEKQMILELLQNGVIM